MAIDQFIYETAINEGFSPATAKIIVAQARLESSNYDSNVFKNNNNLYGMKFVGQPLANRGTLAPFNERSSTCQSGGVCRDRDHYAKYISFQDSVKDVLQRLYKKERKGIGFNELKDVTDPYEFANKLKQRDYFGMYDYSTPQGKEEAKKYGGGLENRLKKVVIDESYKGQIKKLNYFLIGLTVLGISYYVYWLIKVKKVWRVSA
jgi:hypothetical protein